MSTAFCSAIVAAPVDVVWNVLGDFGNWPNFVSQIVRSELEGGSGRGPVGAVRQLTLSDQSSVRERLVEYDDTRRILAYEFDGPHRFPVRTYVGRVQLWPVTVGGGTFIHWSGSFDCDGDQVDAVSETFARIYAAFIRDLAKYLE